ncbi:MAG: lectin like domain-containing protein [Eggerthellaceae bacterium]
MKQELMAGRAVTVGFHADTSMPGQGEIGEYLDTDTWAHYTFESAALNHAVTVVGWDDAYSKENFLEGKQPPADGARLVKNSWGAGSEDSPNWGDWGIDEDGDGVGDGYFWLSYYDMSLVHTPETFDFNVEEPGATYYHIAQYDFMPTVQISTTESDAPARMANVFVAEETQMLRALSVNTAQRGVAVSMEVRLLDEDDLPGEGELVATCERTFEQAGYHRVDLDAPVMLDGGQRYAVVVEQKAPDGTWRVAANSATNKLGVETFVEWGVDAPYYVKGVVNRGESYLYDEAAGGWSDWRDVLDALAADPGQALNALLFDYDNFSIKAYSDPVMAADADLAGLREALEEGQALLASA